MTDWLERVWGENVDDMQRLLILDKARIQTMDATQQAITARDTDCVTIPGGCTPICQPADVSWNKPLKTAVREQWKIWKRQDLRTPQGNAKMATQQDVIDWISHAWDNLAQQIIIDSFKVCASLQT